MGRERANIVAEFQRPRGRGCRGRDERVPRARVCAAGLQGKSTAMKATKFGMGQGVKRVEDVRLVSGRGTYTSDVACEDALHAVFLRSPHAHARFANRGHRRRARHAGREGRLRRRGLRRARRARLPRPGAQFRQFPDAAEALSGDGRERSRACRRHRRDGRRRHRPFRRATPPRRSPSPGTSCRSSSTSKQAMRPGAPQVFAGAPATSPTTRISATSQATDAVFAAAAACRRRQNRQSARRRQFPGAARRARRI